MTTSNDLGGHGLAQPSYASQRSTGGIGNIPRSVDLHHGQVRLPVKLVELPKLGDLQVSVTASYSSNVAEAVRGSNVDAGTGALGVGWALGFPRVLVVGKQTDTPSSGRFYLVAGGSPYRLLHAGGEDGALRFVSHEQPLWNISYDPAGELWTIVRDDGTVEEYGGTSNERGALQTGVCWGNWVGPSTRDERAHRQVTAWNLARRRLPSGGWLEYGYVADEVAVTSSLGYARASYLTEIRDAAGRGVSLFYALKDERERIARHPVLDSRSAWQDARCDYYLASIDVLARTDDRDWRRSLTAEDDAPAPGRLYSVELGYHPLRDVSGRQPVAGREGWYLKRYLASVTLKRDGQAIAPPTSFDYAFDASAPNPGALTAVTYPGGGTARYDHGRLVLNGDSTDEIFDKNLTIADPYYDPDRGRSTPSTPRVWVAQDYIVVVWCAHDTRGATMEIYSFDGQWTRAWRERIDEALDQDEIRLAAGDGFFALVANNPGRQDAQTLRIFRRDSEAFGRWSRTSVDVHTGNELVAAETSLAVGNDFVVVRFGGQPQVHRVDYDPVTERWRPPRSQSHGGSTHIMLAAAGDFYVTAYHDGQRARHQLSARRGDGSWQIDEPGAATQPFDWDPRYVHSYWSLGSCFAVATYVPRTAAGNGDGALQIMMWSRSYERKPGMTWSLDAEGAYTTVSGATVGSGRYVYQFDGVDWQETVLPHGTSGQPAYAYADGLAIQEQIDGSRVSYVVRTYDPYAGRWRQGTSGEAGAPGAHVYAPSISDRCVTIDREVYVRAPDGSLGEPIATLAADGRSASLVNRGPSYLAVETQPPDVRDTETLVWLLDDSELAGEPVRLRGQRLWVDDMGEGRALSGASAFVTYPARYSFDSPTELTLHRVQAASLSDEAGARQVPVVERLTVDDGYTASVTRYGYDATSAALDASGYSARFARAEEHHEDAAGEDWGGAASRFFNGLPWVVADSGDMDAQRSEQAQRFGSLLDGRLIEHVRWAAGGLETARVILDWDAFALACGQGSAVGVVWPAWMARPSCTRVAEAGLTLFETDPAASASLDAGKISSGLAADFAAAGLPLADGAAVTVVRAGKSWRVAAPPSDPRDGDQRYDLRATPGAIVVYGSRTTRIQATYDPSTGQPISYQRSVLDSAGARREQRHLIRYAWQIASYAPMLAARRLQDKAKECQVDDTAGEVLSATVTTYDADQGWLPRSQLTWTGAVASQGAEPAFDFDGGDDQPGWLRTRTTLLRNACGRPLEGINGDGVRHSTRYDAGGARAIARFDSGSASAGEVSFLDFSGYADSDGWRLDDGSPLADSLTQDDCHSGDRCLALTAGGPALQRSFRSVGGCRRYRLSCWVKTPAGSASAPELAWTIQTGTTGEQTRRVAVEPTGGRWRYTVVHIEVAGDGQVMDCALGNHGGATALVDDVCFAPLDCNVALTSYDPVDFKPTEYLGSNDDSYRLIYDRLGRNVGVVGHENGAMVYRYERFSATDGVFNADDPHCSLRLRGLGEGFYDDFRDRDWSQAWRSDTPSRWTVDRRRLVHTGAEVARIERLRPAALARFALRLELSRAQGALSSWSLQAGALAVRGQGDQVRLEVAGQLVASADLPAITAAELLWVVSPASAQLFVDGRRALSWVGATKVAGKDTGKVAGPLAIELADDGACVAGVLLLEGCTLGMICRDGAGRVTQRQTHGDADVQLSQQLYDALGRAHVTTRSARIDGELVGYRPGFVRSFDPLTGVMQGEVADGYRDGGFPYTRDVYLRGSGERVVARGLPGETLAVRPGNDHVTRIEQALNVAGAGGLGSELPVARYRIERRRDANGEVHELLYGPHKEVIGWRRAADGAEARLYYDARGHLAEVRPPNYHAPPEGSQADDWIIHQRCDVQGRVLEQSSKTGGTRRRVYDRAGRLRFQLDDSGVGVGSASAPDRIVYYRYDRRGRPREGGTFLARWDRDALAARADDASYPADGAWLTRYHYDGDEQPAGEAASGQVGYLTQVETRQDVQEPGVVQRMRYDSAGNLARFEQTVGELSRVVEACYDRAGNVIELRYPCAPGAEPPLTLHKRYDSRGQLVAMQPSDGPERFCFELGYTPDGMPAWWRSSGSQVVAHERSYAYDQAGWLARIDDPVFGEELDYHGGEGHGGARFYDGHIAGISLGAGADQERWRYDYRAGQLSVAQRVDDPGASLGAAQPLVYDADGNLASLSIGETTARYGFVPGTARIRTAADGSRVDYDADGAVCGRGALGLEHDPRSGLLRLGRDSASGEARRYLHGVSEQRVATADLSGALLDVQVLGPDGHPLAGGARGDQRLVIYGPLGPLASFDAQSGVALELDDHIGSLRRVVAADGSLLARFDYGPFGELGGQARSGPWLPRYATMPYDPFTASYDGRARRYDPGLRRFWRTDPSQQGFSPYAYAANNPVAVVDPDGHAPWWSWLVSGLELAGGAVLGIAGGVVAALGAPRAGAAIAAVGVDVIVTGAESMAYSIEADHFDAGIFASVNAMTMLSMLEIEGGLYLDVRYGTKSKLARGASDVLIRAGVEGMSYVTNQANQATSAGTFWAGFGFAEAVGAVKGMSYFLVGLGAHSFAGAKWWRGRMSPEQNGWFGRFVTVGAYGLAGGILNVIAKSVQNSFAHFVLGEEDVHWYSDIGQAFINGLAEGVILGARRVAQDRLFNNLVDTGRRTEHFNDIDLPSVVGSVEDI